LWRFFGKIRSPWPDRLETVALSLAFPEDKRADALGLPLELEPVGDVRAGTEAHDDDLPIGRRRLIDLGDHRGGFRVAAGELRLGIGAELREFRPRVGAGADVLDQVGMLHVSPC
jgi:hypothetical protein